MSKSKKKTVRATNVTQQLNSRKSYKLKRKVTFGKSKGFFCIYDARTINYINTIVKLKPGTVNLGSMEALPLRVISDSGVEVKDDFQVNITELYGPSKKGNKHKHFYSDGFGGITFTIKILLKEDDVYQSAAYNKLHGRNKKTKLLVWKLLNTLYINMAPVRVVTEAMDVQNGTYIITNINKKTQVKKGYSEWELEFTTYKSVKFGNFSSNASLRKAIGGTGKKRKRKQSKRQKLSKCKLKNLRYSKKKTKAIPCVSYMQSVLYRAKFLKKSQIDGWYGWYTAHALKKFQRKYKKKYNLKVTGQVDKNTLKALCEAKL